MRHNYCCHHEQSLHQIPVCQRCPDLHHNDLQYNVHLFFHGCYVYPNILRLNKLLQDDRQGHQFRYS